MAIQYRKILGNHVIAIGTNKLIFGSHKGITYAEAFKLLQNKMLELGNDRYKKAFEELKQMEAEYTNKLPFVKDGFIMKDHAEAMLEVFWYDLQVWFNKDDFPYEEKWRRKELIGKGGSSLFNLWYKHEEFKSYEDQWDLIITCPEWILTFWNEKNKSHEKYKELKGLLSKHAKKEDINYLEMKGLI